MKVYRNGKELENATVTYDKSGNPQYVIHGGLTHFAKFFTFEEEKIVKKTRTTKSKKTK